MRTSYIDCVVALDICTSFSWKIRGLISFSRIILRAHYECFCLTGLGGMHLVSLSVEGGGHLPPTTMSPGDMVCVRISDKKRGGSTMECMRGSVYSLAEDNNSIAIAIEARYGDPTFSRLFGKSLRLDRISALADATTYQVASPFIFIPRLFTRNNLVQRDVVICLQ